MNLYPTPAQIEELLAGPPDQPVVMLNLLRFKPEASDANGLSGRESYLRYAAEMRKIVESRGGRFVWSGSVDSVVIGSSDPGWHAVGLVEYPSRKVFVEIATSKEVATISGPRSAGLEGQWLIATTANAG